MFQWDHWADPRPHLCVSNPGTIGSAVQSTPNTEAPTGPYLKVSALCVSFVTCRSVGCFLCFFFWFKLGRFCWQRCFWFERNVDNVSQCMLGMFSKLIAVGLDSNMFTREVLHVSGFVGYIVFTCHLIVVFPGVCRGLWLSAQGCLVCIATKL